MASSPRSPSTSGQLALSIALQDDATFDNFYAGANQQAKQAVWTLSEGVNPLQEPYLYLWGGTGCGASHLLQAACHQVEAAGQQSFYLPLHDVVAYGPEVLEGLEGFDLVCLDDLQCLAGKTDWQLALFHLFNRLRDSGKRLLVAADKAPAQLSIDLPDLASRLAWGLVYQLHSLSDEDKLTALKLRAERRGFQLTDEVAQFILHRSPRDMGQLFELLQRLDRASLSAQRKVTIPFVKSEMNW